ncbi:MAG: hypothetical protein LC746_07180 [Acidobacteria bacterium]|nr:hypothetical protein [Acidobacteriota bacterium]
MFRPGRPKDEPEPQPQRQQPPVQPAQTSTANEDTQQRYRSPESTSTGARGTMSSEIQPNSGKAYTESDALARDIKEGTLTGFVGNGTNMTGEANFKGMLRVDGHLSGRVSSQDGTLIHADAARRAGESRVARRDLRDRVLRDRVLGGSLRHVGRVLFNRALFNRARGVGRRRQERSREDGDRRLAVGFVVRHFGRDGRRRKLDRRAEVNARDALTRRRARTGENDPTKRERRQALRALTPLALFRNFDLRVSASPSPGFPRRVRAVTASARTPAPSASSRPTV